MRNVRTDYMQSMNRLTAKNYLYSNEMSQNYWNMKILSLSLFIVGREKTQYNRGISSLFGSSDSHLTFES